MLFLAGNYINIFFLNKLFFSSFLIFLFRQIPHELIILYPGRKIDFHMVRKSGLYVAAKLKAFSGEGYRLGSVVPRLVESTASCEISNIESSNIKGIFT